MAAVKMLKPCTVSEMSLDRTGREEAMHGDGKWWENEPNISRRTSLPEPLQEMPSIKVWSILKNAIGGDLLSLQLPLQMHEPLSHHQKVAEDLEYTELLDQAASKPKGSIERLMLVGALPVTWYAAAHRTTRPLNCCWGETFELVMPEKRMRAVFETVFFDMREQRYMHAGIVEGEKWAMEIEDEPLAKFNGTGIDIHNERWMTRLTFEDGDVYEWHKGTSTLNNLIMGKMYFTHSGQITITCKTAPMSLVIDFPPKPKMLSGFGRGKADAAKQFQVTGTVYLNGKALAFPRMTGECNKQLTVEDKQGSLETLWEARPMPANPNKYGMTVFASGLVDLPPQLATRLPPTDTRRRPDVRAFDAGDYETAAVQKQRLEDTTYRGIQRVNRTPARCLKPRWFQLMEADGLKKPWGIRKWRYSGGYWEARASGSWGGIPASYFGTQYLAAGENEE